MPNHCINEIIFSNVVAAAQDEILKATCNADGDVDFEILVPIPPQVWRGSVGIRHEKAFGRDMTALEWCRHNWGTKWNAYDHHPIERTDDALTLRFETAWGPPYPWLCALMNTIKRPFEHNWLSEGGAPAIAARFNFANLSSFREEPWSEEEADKALARHLHKLLWGVEEFSDDAA
jgi:hypothetical protein